MFCVCVLCISDMMLMIITVQVKFFPYVVDLDLSYYKKFFETPFFVDMERFYTICSEVFLDIPVIECIKEVESIDMHVGIVSWWN